MAQWAHTRSDLVARWFRCNHSRRNPVLSGGEICKLESGGSQSGVPGPGAAASHGTLPGMQILYSTLTSAAETGVGVVVVQSLTPVQLFATPWTAACQASLSFNISPSLLKLMSMESVMPSNHLILCHPLLLLPSIFPSIQWISSSHQGAKALVLASVLSKNILNFS